MIDPQEPPLAVDFMKRPVHVVTPEMPLAQVIRLLLKHQVSNAPVVEEQVGKQILVGFISEHDCLAVLSNEAFFGSPSPQQSARTIMRMHPVCVTPETELFSLVSIFVSHGFRHLPVVNEGALLGIVSRRDILRAMETYYDHAIEDRDRQRFPPDLTKIVNHRFLVDRK